MSRASTIATVVAGIAIAVGVSVASSMTAHDAFELIAIAGGAALAAALTGGLATFALRRRSIAAQFLTVAISTVAAVGVGAWAAARAMILSGHGLAALVVVLVAAGTVGVVATSVLASRIVTSSTALVEATRSLGNGEPLPTASTANRPSELSRLADELAATSARLAETRERERALDASRRELIAWVSHDLRTPLAGIRAMVEALEDGVVDDPVTVDRYHRTLREEADRLAGLIDDLFELSRTQAGVLSLQLERVSLSDVVSDALAGSAPIAAAKGVALRGVMRDQIPELHAAAPELLRALRNILENAIRHTPSDGTVIVEAGLHADQAFVSVIDDGGGIPEPDLGRVFDVAFRGDPARSGEGAGLGLAIARGLVEAHHGEITVRNENGGCRFTVSLPLSIT
jgi:signal transduction histidine kinase